MMPLRRTPRAASFRYGGVPGGRATARTVIVLLLAATVGLSFMTGMGSGSPAAAQFSDRNGTGSGRLSVRVGKHSTYGRLVLDLPFDLTYRALRSGNDVVLQFDKPVGGPTQPTLGTLDTYLAGAWMSDDGRALVLRLSGDYPVRTFPLPRRIVVDFHQPGSPGLSQGVAPTPSEIEVLTPGNTGTFGPVAPGSGELSAPEDQNAPVSPVAPTDRRGPGPSAAGPTMGRQAGGAGAPAIPAASFRLRTGEHKGYTRVVFDWPAGVRYNIQALPGAVALHFDRPADIDPSALLEKKPKHISGFSIRGNDQGTLVLLGVRDGGGVHHFALDNAIVFDVYGSSVAAPDGSVRPLPADASPPVAAGPPAEIGTPGRATGGTGRRDRRIDDLARELRPDNSAAPPDAPAPTTGGGAADGAPIGQSPPSDAAPGPDRRVAEPIDPGSAARLRKMQELLAEPAPTPPGASEPVPQDEAFQPLQ